MATAVSFYPPGTYVALANGEIAVSAQRGAAANTPMVVSAMHADGMPLGHYLLRDTSLRRICDPFAGQSAADQVEDQCAAGPQSAGQTFTKVSLPEANPQSPIGRPMRSWMA
ncbi:MAG: hypothetical protein IPO43_06015 [Rhodoferax sp.]|nr:hypothetical protein [Rhodoferax sp.]